MNPEENFPPEILKGIEPPVRTSRQTKVEKMCHKLHLTNIQTYAIERRMRLAIELGLSADMHDESSVKCLPTFVRRLPTGSERQKCLALDLGGTNFRVLTVELYGSPDKEPEKICHRFTIPESVKKSSGYKLFDFIADCISKFLHTYELQDEALTIGFTFSFPCTQTSLKSGILNNWTKGFHCPDIVGKDVCQLLMDAIHKKGDIKVEFGALLNDTTGCLISCAWRDPRCRIGLIVGTGCNACYLEERRNIKKMRKAASKDSDEDETMVINTEWGAFGENGALNFIKTKWDKKVDAESINPGKQIYEKMISGMYMGELVRYILVDLADSGLVFEGLDITMLRQKGSFETRHICEIEYDPIGSFDRTRKVFKEVLETTKDIDESDCFVVRYVCEEISRRAAMLLAAGISALLKKMDYKDVVVAVDGTLFRCHPLFYIMMKKKITQLMGVEYKFDMVQSVDGSGVGAAVIAAVVSNGE